MKMQTGMRVETEVWRTYRALCSRERLRPSLPVEEFLRLFLGYGSALGFLGIVRGAAKAQAEGVNAYARVLLDWYTHGKYFFHAVGEDEASVEGFAAGGFEGDYGFRAAPADRRSTYYHAAVTVP